MGDGAVTVRREDGVHTVGRVQAQGVGLGGVLHLHLGDGLAHVQGALQRKAVVHPIHQLAGLVQGRALGGVGVGVAVLRAVQHHADVGLTVLHMPAGEVLPFAQAAGFAALGVAAVIIAAEGGGDHHIGGADVVAAVHIAGVQAHVVQRGLDHFLEQVKAHGVAQNKVHIPRGGQVALVQAAGVHKHGVGAADVLGAGIHHGHKVGGGAAADQLGHRQGGLVGAGQHHGVQHLAQGAALAGANVRIGAAVNINIVLHGVGDGGGGIVQVVTVFFQQQNGRHQLGQAGGLVLSLAVLFIHDDVGVGVYNVGRGGRNLKIGGKAHRRGGQGKHAGQQHHCQQAGQSTFQFLHVDNSLKTR